MLNDAEEEISAVYNEKTINNFYTYIAPEVLSAEKVVFEKDGVNETADLNTDTQSESDSYNPDSILITVYVSEHGGRFHREDCGYLKNSIMVYELTLADVQCQGIPACSVCRADQE